MAVPGGISVFIRRQQQQHFRFLQDIFGFSSSGSMEAWKVRSADGGRTWGRPLPMKDVDRKVSRAELVGGRR